MISEIGYVGLLPHNKSETLTQELWAECKCCRMSSGRAIGFCSLSCQCFGFPFGTSKLLRERSSGLLPGGWWLGYQPPGSQGRERGWTVFKMETFTQSPPGSVLPHRHLFLLFPSPGTSCFTFSRGGGTLTFCRGSGQLLGWVEGGEDVGAVGLTAFEADLKVGLCLTPPSATLPVTRCDQFLSLMGDFAE